MALPIEDYALIGDRHTAALIGRDGSVDWLCLPRFDSPACFAALLGTEDHGRWQLCPVGEYDATRRYLDASAILETTFSTDTGEVTLVDVMPFGDHRADLVRRITGVRGTVRMQHEWVVRTDYGNVRPWVRRRHRRRGPVITAVAGPDQLILRGPRLPSAVDRRHRDEFDVAEGDELTFSTTWVPSYEDTPDLAHRRAARGRPCSTTRPGLSVATNDVPHPDLVHRSLLTLRLLTHEQTGGIVAAPTTSLPEDFGGERNWDYRYCWLRDAALTLDAFIHAGYTEEATVWRNWLLRAVGRRPGGPPDHVRRRRRPPAPRTRARASARVRRQPAGADRERRRDQRQTDVLGEVMYALDRAREPALEADDNAWALQSVLLEELARTWQEPDHGLWEIRGPPQRFTHSAVMSWVAFDRAVRAVELHGRPGPVEAWRALRDTGPRRDPEHGYDADAQHLHPALRHHRGGRLVAAAAAGRLHRRRRPADARHDRGRRAGPDARRPAAALPHRSPASTGSRATSTRSWPARSGWSRRTPAPAAPTTPTRCSTGWSAWPTTWGCSRRSTTRRNGRMVGQLPAGVQPPGTGAGGLPARRARVNAHRRPGKRVPGAGPTWLSPTPSACPSARSP